MTKSLHFIFFIIVALISKPGYNQVSKNKSNIVRPDNFKLNSSASSLMINPTRSFTSDKPALPILEPGTIAANQNIGYNTIPELLTGTPPSGGTPPYLYQWQSSIDIIAFSSISGATSLNYQPGPLTSTTSYRQVQCSSGGVDSAFSNIIS